MLDRYFIDAKGGNTEPHKQAFQLALVQAKLKKTNITLVVPTKDRLSVGIIRDLVGGGSSKQLAKGNIINYSGIEIRPASERTLKHDDINGVIFALWLGESGLERVDACSNAQAIVAVHWALGAVLEWASKHNATDLSWSKS